MGDINQEVEINTKTKVIKKSSSEEFKNATEDFIPIRAKRSSSLDNL
jgi:hypothetical protein